MQLSQHDARSARHDAACGGHDGGFVAYEFDATQSYFMGAQRRQQAPPAPSLRAQSASWS